MLLKYPSTPAMGKSSDPVETVGAEVCISLHYCCTQTLTAEIPLK